ncbi:hypothetical protein NEOKW01_0171 [Nematocida sp. AWRm80]|nr:hypothetical protein NEOKW01_0171 [Nematocida sp. AWRm80]
MEEDKRLVVSGREDRYKNPGSEQNKEMFTHTNKRNMHKNRSENKRETERKEVKRKEEEKAEKSVCVVPPKERKPFQLMIDGIELTQSIVNEEKKKHDIEIAPEEKIPETIEKAQKTEKTEKVEKIEKTVKAEKIEKSHKEPREPKEPIRKEAPKKEAPQEIVVTGTIAKRKEEEPEDDLDTISPTEINIVKGIPKGINPTTGTQYNAWEDKRTTYLVTQKLFSSGNKAATNASAPVKGKKRPLKSKPTEPLPTMTVQPKEKEKESSSTETKATAESKAQKEKEPKQKKHPKDKEALIEEPASQELTVQAPTKPETEPVAPVAPEPTSTAKALPVQETSSQEEISVGKKPEEESPSPQSPAEKTVEVPAATAAPEKKKREFPLVYSKAQLLSYKEGAKHVKVSIDKSIFNKSTSFGKKKREFNPKFKTLFNNQKKALANIAPTVFSSIEQHVSEFNTALNQVTNSNIDQIAKKMLSIKVSTNEEMEVLAKMYFERTIQEEAYIPVFAKLAQKIQRKFRSQQEVPYEEGKYRVLAPNPANPTEMIELVPRSVFGKVFIDTLENAFKTTEPVWAHEVINNGRQTVTAAQLAAKVQEMSDNKEKEYKRVEQKKRVLAITRMTAELYNEGVLSNRVLFGSMHLFTQTPTPETIERLCHLLRYAGEKMERNVPSRPVITECINWLDTHSKNYSIRYRFMVEDIIELRARKWKGSQTSTNSDDSEWQTQGLRTKDKRKWQSKYKKEEGPKDEKPKEEKKQMKISDLIEANPKEYASFESIIAGITSNKHSNSAIIKSEVSHLLNHSANILFFVALIKITVEGYDISLENGLDMVKEWIKHSPEAIQRKSEVFSYIEEIMPDLVDDAPLAPKNLETVKSIVMK